MIKKTRRELKVGRLIWAVARVAVFAAGLFGLWTLPSWAHDCLRDPLNARDCLRTPGTAQLLGGITATTVSVLVNGQQLVQTLVQSTGGGAPATVQTGEPPPETRGPETEPETGGEGPTGPTDRQEQVEQIRVDAPAAPNRQDPKWWFDTAKNISGPITDFVNARSLDQFQTLVKNTTVVGPGGVVTRTDWSSYLSGLKNLQRMNGITDAIGKGFWGAGVLSDTLDNMTPRITPDGKYIEGDSVPYGLGKATLSGAAGLSLGKSSPALGVMDLGNFVVFGGSKASEIISLGKTITGGINAAVDGLRHGSDYISEAAAAGKYGPCVKNLAALSEEAGAALGDPQQFAGDFSDVVTDQQFYDDMYQSSYDLWKPPPDAGTLKTVACAGGELVTDAAIKAAELAAKTGQVLGDATAKVGQFFSSLW